MIGGVESQVLTQTADALEIGIRTIQRHWPKAVIENGETAERYHHVRDVPFGKMSELFVYRDAAAADRWDEDGAVPEVFNTMIHLLEDPGMLTIVVDEKDALMQEVVADITSAVNEVPHANATPME
jgi:hypothetical protein